MPPEARRRSALVHLASGIGNIVMSTPMLIGLCDLGFAIDVRLDADYAEILEMQNQRDQHDTQRESGGLKAAQDSMTVWTDGLSEEQVLENLIEIVQEKQHAISERIAAKTQ